MLVRVYACQNATLLEITCGPIKRLSYFRKGSPGDHFCLIVFSYGHWFQRRCFKCLT